MFLKINGQHMDVPENWQASSLLWVLREHLGLVGSKFGCGVGVCGACTVHVDGVAKRSCGIPVTQELEKSEIVTIEGLAYSAEILHPVQEAWIEASVPQCGYCQAGQIMSASALLNSNANPSDLEIDEAMSGNLCRCGTYNRIRSAIHSAAKKKARFKGEVT